MIAEIAVKCLDSSGARSQAMREVAEQLARINHKLDNSIVEENNEETETMVHEPLLPCDFNYFDDELTWDDELSFLFSRVQHQHPILCYYNDMSINCP
ncbi:hypothetical protein ACJRO7_023773 [Eucalyptus globulus]|uniref:Uncharacterized protein n=1 Tax=Eucalyptus globulus TaxID=34317 RepID=A0ABD3K315_EUCGL